MLEYIGNGDFIEGIPARDLTESEVALYGGAERLIKSGLYKRSEKKDQPKKDEIKSK